MRSVILGKGNIRPETSGGFIMQIETTTANEIFTLPTRDVAATTPPINFYYDAIVDWGDGTYSNVTGNNVNNTKTYTTAGTYNIEIKGRFDALYFNNTGSRLAVKKILSWGGSEFQGLSITSSMFYGCSNLNELASGGIKFNSNYIGATAYSLSFQNCTSLTSIPSDLFRYSPLASGFASTFLGCTNLTSIPADLFRYNPLVTTFATTFRGCTLLATIPSNLFVYNPLVTSYQQTFYQCNKLQLRNDMFDTANFLDKSINWIEFVERSTFTGTQGTMQDIWNANYGTGTPNLGTSTTRPFGLAGNSTTSISNYNDIPTGWKA